MVISLFGNYAKMPEYMYIKLHRIILFYGADNYTLHILLVNEFPFHLRGLFLPSAPVLPAFSCIIEMQDGTLARMRRHVNIIPLFFGIAAQGSQINSTSFV